VQLQQQGNISTVSASVLSRSKFVPDRQLVYKPGNVLRSRGSSSRRTRLLAVAELPEAVTAVEPQFTDPSSSAINSLPLSSGSQVLFADL
jgi:hypothetical protein